MKAGMLLRVVLLMLPILVAECGGSGNRPLGGGGVELEGEVVPAPAAVGSDSNRMPLPLVYQGRSVNPPGIASPDTLAGAAAPEVAVVPPSQPTSQPDPADAAPTTPPFRVCSPLVDESLVSLPEIVSDPYSSPPPGREERHHGVDFAYFNRQGRASIDGAGVQAVLNGQVAAALSDTFPYGNVIIIETPGRWLPPELAGRINLSDRQSLYVLYAHMKAAPGVGLNSFVEACTALGAVGRSGNAGGAHLHLETRLGPGGLRLTSLGFYLAQSTPEERENYLLWRTSWIYQHFDPMVVLQP